MKKPGILIILGICACVITLGCARVAVKNEYQKYKTVYVGWLNLQNQNYGRYGFLNKADWAREVVHLNIDGLQKYTRDYMRGWEVIGAVSPNTAPPRRPETIVVRLTNPVLNNVTLSVRCGMDFYDGASGKLLKHVVAESASVAYAHHSRWGYVHQAITGGNLMDVMYNLAYDIYNNLTH